MGKEKKAQSDQARLENQALEAKASATSNIPEAQKAFYCPVLRQTVKIWGEGPCVCSRIHCSVYNKI